MGRIGAEEEGAAGNLGRRGEGEPLLRELAAPWESPALEESAVDKGEEAREAPRSRQDLVLFEQGRRRGGSGWELRRDVGER